MRHTTAKKIYQEIKERPYRDGEALIREYAMNFVGWLNYKNFHPLSDEHWTCLAESDPIEYNPEDLLNKFENETK